MVRLVTKFKYLSMELPHRAVAVYLYLCDRGMMAGEGELPTVGRFTAEKMNPYDAQGSLTIYKYENVDTLFEMGEYKTQEELKQAIADAGYDADDGMEDVIFSYVKVGDVAQSNQDGTTATVVIGYTVDDSALLTLLQSTGEELETAFTVDGTTYYTSTSLQGALNKLTQTQVEGYMSTASGVEEMDPTDENGYTTEEDLGVGLYLIVETGYPATVTATSRPFFVSIPMTDSTTDDGYTWTYDVVAYPKNSTEDIKITKSVVEADDEGGYNESADIDGEIGQNKTFIIRADVPAAVTVLETYKITDTLSLGLTFAGQDTVKVRGLKADGSVTGLTEGTAYDFSLSQDGKTLTINFSNYISSLPQCQVMNLKRQKNNPSPLREGLE